MFSHYLIAHLSDGLKTYGSGSQKALEQERDRRIARTPPHVCPSFLIVDEAEWKRLRALDIRAHEAKKAANIKRGAEKRAKKQAARKAAGRKPHFILCPTCGGKSKKLRSEMGGLQTRRCKKGHLFEVDTFFGFESGKRRIEQFDRPYFAPGGQNYNDWVQGRYKDDPLGKMDMLKDILERDRKARGG